MTDSSGHFDVKSVIAIMVIAGTFAIMGAYVIRGQVPDATIVGMVSLPLGAVIGFYFGHINGAATALANATTTLATAAQAAVEKRNVLPPPPASAAPEPPLPPPAVVVAAPAIPPTGGIASGTP